MIGNERIRLGKKCLYTVHALKKEYETLKMKANHQVDFHYLTFVTYLPDDISQFH